MAITRCGRGKIIFGVVKSGRRGHGVAGQGAARRGAARRGVVKSGVVWRGNYLRCGVVWCVVVVRGKARRYDFGRGVSWYIVARRGVVCSGGL